MTAVSVHTFPLSSVASSSHVGCNRWQWWLLFPAGRAIRSEKYMEIRNGHGRKC